MSQPIVYRWPAADDEAIVLSTQLPAGVRNFTLNGNLSLYGADYVSLGNISRNFVMNSAVDLSAINFTYTGISNGMVITETIAGPVANTPKPTLKAFNFINSISVDADMTGAVKIGTYNTGYTNWFCYDYYRKNQSLAAQVQVLATVFNYSLEVTLDDVTKIAEADVAKFTPVVAMTAATTNQLGNLIIPVAFVRVKSNAGSNATGSAIITLMQQGAK